MADASGRNNNILGESFLCVCVFKKKFWPHSVAYGTLVPQPGIELMSPALEAWSLNHWTAREVPKDFNLKTTFLNILH